MTAINKNKMINRWFALAPPFTGSSFGINILINGFKIGSNVMGAAIGY